MVASLLLLAISSFSAEMPPALKVDNITIPYPLEGFVELFLKNSDNPRFKQINFDKSLRLFFIPDIHTESFLWENDFIPKIGFKATVKPAPGSNDEFSRFIQNLNKDFSQVIPKNTLINDTCLGRVCSIQNIFPIDTVVSESSAICLWLLEYEIPDETTKNVMSKNYYYGSNTMLIGNKMLTLSTFVDLATEVSSKDVILHLSAWGNKTVEGNKKP